VCVTSMFSRMLLPERVQSHGSSVTFKLELGNAKVVDSDGILSAFTDASGLPFSALVSRCRVWNVISKTFNYLDEEAGVSHSAPQVLPCLSRTLLHHPYPYAFSNKIISAKRLCSANRVWTSALCMSPMCSEIVLLTTSLKPLSSSIVEQKA
jgi:hypothetical protein